MARKLICDNDCGTEVLCTDYCTPVDDEEVRWVTVNRREHDIAVEISDEEDELKVINTGVDLEFCTLKCAGEYLSAHPNL